MGFYLNILLHLTREQHCALGEQHSMAIPATTIKTFVTLQKT